jgi:CubicO group peptidase (beta-lactamase class C family)
MLGSRLAILASVVTTAGLVVSPAHAKPAPDFSQTMQTGRQAMREAMKTTRATSVSIALLSDGKVVWSQGFGKITPQGTKPTATTRYGIGSVSKTVTALAVMQLVDRGKVSLDAPVVRYLPEFTMLSPQYRQITVRMLLNHSAGLPGSDYSNGFSYQPISGYPQQVLAALSKERLKATPGAVNVYCNDCFTLAGEVVARVSGMSLQEYVATQIFKPLGMTHSGFSGAVSGTVAPVIEKGQVQPMQYTNIAASGGVVSTPEDMLKLARVFTGEKSGIVSGARIAEMGTDQTTTTLKVGPRAELRYGLGWDDVRSPALADVGVTAWVKGGDVGQHHAGFAVAPDQDLAVVVLGAGEGFSSSVAQTVGARVLLQALVDTAVIKNSPKPVGSPPKRVAPTAKQLNRMTGVYLNSMASARLLKGQGRFLRLQALENGQWVPRPERYVLRADGRWWSTQEPQSLYLKQAWDRTYLVLRQLGGTGTYYNSFAFGQKMRSSTTVPAWSARIGQAWLLANENPESVAWEVPALTFHAIPGLSGYLMADGAMVGSVPFDAGNSPELGSMFLQIPLMAGRDLYDFDVARHGPEDVLQFKSSVLRQQATVPALTRGAVTIGSRGFAEWLTTAEEQTVTVSGQAHWKTYDAQMSLVDSGGSSPAPVTVKARGFLVVFAPAGAVVSIG